MNTLGVDELFEREFKELLERFELERVNCIVCNNTSYEELGKKYGMSLVKCKFCGHIYVNPRFPKKAIYDMYDVKYWNVLTYRMNFQNVKERILFDYTNSKLKLLRDVLPFKTDGILLDVGCSNGALVKAANEFGFRAFGLEINDGVVESARKIYPGITIFRGELKEKRFPENMFDIVTMYDVIEHLANPLEELIEIHRILKRNGLLIIETLTTDSLNFKINLLDWEGISPIEHLHYFNTKNLINVLERIGYEILEVKSPHEDNIVVHCVKK